MTNKQPAAPAELTKAAIRELPNAIELVGPAFRVLAEASVLIRKGFMFSTKQSPEIFASTGHAVVLLVSGDPEQAVIEAASEALEHALSREQFAKLDAEQRAAAAAKKLADETAKAAAKASLAAQIASAEAELKALQVAHAAA
jgi:hypothetical protein